MKNMELLIYPMLLLVLTFYGAKVMKKGTVSPEYMSISQTGMIKAAACMGVILHHLVQRITGYGAYDKGPVTVFCYLGIVFTGLFFFFSGYGLITNVREREEYLRTFPARRLPAVLVPFWAVNGLLVLLERYAHGNRSGVKETLCKISGVTLINGNGWFVIEITLLYLAFYILFRLIRQRDLALVLLCLFTLALIRFGFLRGHGTTVDKSTWFRGEWWFNSTITFPAGMVYARFREKADAFCARHYPVLLSLSAVLGLVSLGVSVYTVVHFGYYHEYMSFTMRRDELLTLASQMAACLTFAAFVLLLGMRIALGNRLLVYIGGISLELFLVHGYFVDRIFGGRRMEDVVYFAAVILCSTACAAVLAPADRWLVRKMTGLSEKKRPVNDTLERKIAEQKRKRTIRRTVIISAAGFLVYAGVFCFPAAIRYLLAAKEYEEECAAIRGASTGDEVLWGHYNTDNLRIGEERLTWIVIGRDQETVCLLSKVGIAGSFYHHKHEAVSWENSDLRALLNSDEYLGIFSRYEKDSIEPVGEDMITLLTVAEAQSAFGEDKDRELQISAVAKQQGTNINSLSKHHEWDMKGYRSSWWWLRGSSGLEEITAPIVTVDGTILEAQKPVNKPGGAVRPVIRVRCRQGQT